MSPLTAMRSSRPRTQQAFTLIEVLVVVFIIGIIISFATLSISGRSLDDKMEEEARRLHELFRLARDEAGMTGFELGWVNVDDGYRFLALGDQGWEPFGDNTPLRPRPVEKPLAIEVQVDDIPIPTDPERIAPQILFLSSGEVTPFKVDVMGEKLPQKYRLQGNLLGQIEFARIAWDEP